MATTLDRQTLLIGAGLGALAASTAILLGPVAISSGWTSVIAAGGLGGAAGILAARPRMLRPKAAARPDRIEAPVFVELRDASWGQAMKPEEWLRDAGALAVAPGETAGYLRARLSTCLTPLDTVLPQDPLGEPLAPSDMLALAFAARAASGTDVRQDLARRILDGLAKSHPRASQATAANLRAACSEALGQPGVCERILAAKERHGTRESFLIGLLAAARRRGVLAPAEFLWLKGFERGLWYALQNLGRQDCYVEGLAAMDHYRHEAAEGKASRAPRVDGAVEALAALCEGIREGSAA